MPSLTPQTRKEYSTYLKLYFFFAKDRQVQHDLKRVSICCYYYQFSDASVQCFGGFVGPLFDLFEGSALRDEIIDGGSEFFSGKRSGSL